MRREASLQLSRILDYSSIPGAIQDKCHPQGMTTGRTHPVSKPRSCSRLRVSLEWRPFYRSHGNRALTVASFCVGGLLREDRRRQDGLRGTFGWKHTEDNWVFVRADGSPWEPGAFSLAFSRFIKRAKPPHIRFHDLRHSFGTLALTFGRRSAKRFACAWPRIDSNHVTHLPPRNRTLQDDAAARINALLGNAGRVLSQNRWRHRIPMPPFDKLRVTQGVLAMNGGCLTVPPSPCHNGATRLRFQRKKPCLQAFGFSANGNRTRL